MIVRLKGKPRRETVYYNKRVFQFYDSPIKRNDGSGITIKDKSFQFYDSPIKRTCSRHQDVSRPQFQFYDSPIKRIYEHTLSKIIGLLFQFYDSPIKRSFSKLEKETGT